MKCFLRSISLIPLLFKQAKRLLLSKEWAETVIAIRSPFWNSLFQVCVATNNFSDISRGNFTSSRTWVVLCLLVMIFWNQNKWLSICTRRSCQLDPATWLSPFAARNLCFIRGMSASRNQSQFLLVQLREFPFDFPNLSNKDANTTFVPVTINPLFG